MKGFLLFASVLVAAPLPAHAAPTDTPHAYAYLGHVTAAGAWEGERFDELPSIAYADRDAMEFRAGVSIVAREGVKLHAAASPKAAEVGRHKSGTVFRLIAVHETYGYVWGEVQRASEHADLDELRRAAYERAYPDGESYAIERWRQAPRDMRLDELLALPIPSSREADWCAEPAGDLLQSQIATGNPIQRQRTTC